ncbi:hypothetical protein V6N13_117856 [Hibiscus sabdariffa]
MIGLAMYAGHECVIENEGIDRIDIVIEDISSCASDVNGSSMQVLAQKPNGGSKILVVGIQTRFDSF